MSHFMSRRRLLAGSAALGAAVATLAACTTTTSGGNTAATLDVARVTAYAQAAINFAKIVLTTPSIVVVLGAERTSQVQHIASEAQVDLNSFRAAAGDAVTVSFDKTSAVAAAQSILTDIQTLLAIVSPLVPSLPVSSAAAATITAAVEAATTIASILAAMLAAGVGRVSAPITTMPEDRALSTLGVAG